MVRFFQLWRTFDLIIARIESFLLLIITLILIFGVFLQGVLRTVFEYNPLGMSELAVQLLVWLGFLSASLATHKRRHIVVDLIPQVLARYGMKRGEGMVRIIVSLGTFLFLLYLLRAAWFYWESPGVQFRTTTILAIPAKYVTIMLLWALGMMSLRFLQITCEEVGHLFGFYPEENRWSSQSLSDLLELINKQREPAP